MLPLVLGSLSKHRREERPLNKDLAFLLQTRSAQVDTALLSGIHLHRFRQQKIVLTQGGLLNVGPSVAIIGLVSD